MLFQIRRAINNIYLAYSLDDGALYTARIKGKVMKKDEVEYNPVAVGDIAIGEPYSSTEALISSIEDRKSSFRRWNVKKEMNQTIASNQDQSAIVVSSASPPFRPRFLDRAIACSSGAEILIIMNKSDQGVDPGIELYRNIGFKVFVVSSESGEGLEELKAALHGKVTAFVGQSGVGKSTLINTLMGTSQTTGSVSEKYNRGRHTTNHSLYIESGDIAVIDTPGVREIEVPFEDEVAVSYAFPELRDAHCFYSQCLHKGEDGCVVPDLIEEGKMSEERYESYLRILQTLEERKPFYLRNRKDDYRKNC